MVANSVPLLRQWRLIKALSTTRMGLTVRDMADLSEVSPKTIRRDLDLFRSLGLPLEEIIADHRGTKRWRLGDWENAPAMTLTFDEALALYLSRRLLEPLAGTPFWCAAQSAMKKIRASLSDQVVAYLEQMADKLHFTVRGAGEYAHQEDKIDRLMIAIEDSVVARIVYQSQRATEPVTYPIHPFGIVFHFGSLYLIGYKPEDDDIRTWKVDRIEDVELTDETFDRPKDFDLSRFLSGSFGVYHGRSHVRVRVRFSAKVARYVRESHWHHSQKLTPSTDGSLLAEFELSSTEEFKSWVWSFGRHAVVLEPQSLRQEMMGDLRSLLDVYQDGDPAKGTASRRLHSWDEPMISPVARTLQESHDEHS